MRKFRARGGNENRVVPLAPPSTHARKKQKKKKKKKRKGRAEGRLNGAKGRRKVFKARPINMAGGKPRKLSARFA